MQSTKPTKNKTMATPFKFDTKKHGNTNDNGIKDLPLGKNNYVITKIALVPVKSDSTGRRNQIAIDLRHSNGGKFTKFLEIHPKDKTENEETRARIAAEEFNAFVQAAGFEGVLTPAKFKVLYDKVIGIETVKTTNKASKKEYINVNQVIKDGFPDDELATLGASASDSKAPAKKASTTKTKSTPPEEEEEEEPEEEEEEEDPEEEEPEEEPEEEEEESEEEEEEDDPFA